MEWTSQGHDFLNEAYTRVHVGQALESRQITGNDVEVASAAALVNRPFVRRTPSLPWLQPSKFHHADGPASCELATLFSRLSYTS